RRHTRFSRDWSSDVCSSDLGPGAFLTLLLTTRPKKQQLMDSYIEGLLRLEDTRRSGSEPTVKEHFQSAWHVFYRWFNVLQWLPRSEERRVGKACWCRSAAWG